MSTTYPIKNEEKLRKFKEYYLTIKPMCRNYAMIILGLNTAFRISDLLKLQWQDVFNHKKTALKTISVLPNRKPARSNVWQLTPTYLKLCISYRKRSLPVKRIISFLQEKRNRGTPVPLPGLPHNQRSCRICRAGRTYQLSFPSQNLWLSRMETRCSASPVDGTVQPFFLPHHQALSVH